MQNLLSSRRKSFQWIWGVAGIVFGGLVVWSSGKPWFPVKLSWTQLPKISLISPEISPEKKNESDKKIEPTASSGEYTAVYLDTDQVFYGKAGKQFGQYVALSDVFYYQPGVQSPHPGNIRLVKVGTELHKPKDLVYINRSHVVMTEQLTEESKVTQAILKYKAE